MNYLDFELQIGLSSGHEYPVTIIRSPAGDASGTCRHDPTSDNLQATLCRLEAGDTDEALLMDLGRRLFDRLFVDGIDSVFRASLGQARGRGKGLRVRLRLEPPELAALPWEYLYDADEDRFLAISPETPLVRYVPMRGSARPTSVSSPLRVLVVISNPSDVAPLEVEREKEIIEAALAKWDSQGLVQLHFVEHATVSEISQTMRCFRPHVFHFIGHGQYRNDRAHVMLENDDGRARPVGERDFREFFLGNPETRLVVLNACQTATVPSTRPLAGLSPCILQRNLPGVVAMQYPISDSAAIVFSREFYRGLALGYPVDMAISEARKGIFLEIGCGARDWGIPVLFLRAQDGKLFKVKQPTRPRRPARRSRLTQDGKLFKVKQPTPSIRLHPLVMFFFNLTICIILAFIVGDRVSLVCVSSKAAALSLAAILLLFVHLFWRCFSGLIKGKGISDPIKAGPVTVPISTLASLIDALHPWRLSDRVFGALAIFFLAVAAILGLSPISPFRVRDEAVPIIQTFSIQYHGGTASTLKAGDVIEIMAGAQVLVKAATSEQANTLCAWSASKGRLQPAKECSILYIAPIEGVYDTLTVLVQSPCKTQQAYASLHIKVMQTRP